MGEDSNPHTFDGHTDIEGSLGHLPAGPEIVMAGKIILEIRAPLPDLREFCHPIKHIYYFSEQAQLPFKYYEIYVNLDILVRQIWKFPISISG